MDESPRLHAISDEALSVYRRCRFVHREFWPRDCYRTREPPEDVLAFFDQWEKHGEQLVEDHPDQFELLEGGWDHEHCNVCWLRIEPGDWYWPNKDESVDEVDLCEECYRRVMGLLNAKPDAPPDCGGS
jgi:hypothetical protein